MPFLDHSLSEFLGRPWLEIVLTLTAALCGGIVGAEREKREKPAGLRTLVLVCLGSASFTMVSYAFTTTTGDSGRVSAQIVTGIGFLGAGAILHGAGLITGMTTAATIWVTAAIGMIAGAGYAPAALALSIFVRLLLTGIYHWETRRFRPLPPTTVRLLIDPARGKTRIRLEKIMDTHHVAEATFAPMTVADGSVEVSLHFALPLRQRRDFFLLSPAFRRCSKSVRRDLRTPRVRVRYSTRGVRGRRWRWGLAAARPDRGGGGAGGRCRRCRRGRRRGGGRGWGRGRCAGLRGC